MAAVLPWLTVLAAVPTPFPPRLVTHNDAAAPMPARCGSDGSRCLRQLTMPAGATVAAYANFPLTGSATVRHAVVVIHGAGGNAAFTFAGMMQAAGKSGADTSTLVIAPWFKTNRDQPGAGEARWSSGGWKIGDSALRPEGLSSFAVVDSILVALADKTKFPNLTWTTLTGHSAGGQFTDRYASLSTVPTTLPMLVTYVVANPSSYLYFDQLRPGFTSPAARCPGYNNYKYGLAGRTGYAARLTAPQTEQLFAIRRVTILNGGADTAQNGDMDASCAAMLQGPNRLSRGENFFAHIRARNPTAPHDRIVVPGISHNHLDLFNSPAASIVLFGPGHPPATTSRPNTRVGTMPDQTPPDDFAIVAPDGLTYGPFGNTPSSTLRDHLPGPMGNRRLGQRLRMWYVDTFTNELRRNNLADHVIARLGYQHPTGWYGPVLITREQHSTTGVIPPLTATIRATLTEIVHTSHATHTGDT